MKTRLNKTEAAKIDFLKIVGKEDFPSFVSFHRGDDALESVRIENGIPLSDELAAIKVKDIDFILFRAKKHGIVVPSVCVLNGGRFEVRRMSLEAFNRYECYMRDALTAKPASPARRRAGIRKEA